MHYLVRRVAPVVTLCLLAGCANVSVHKIPTPTQYSTWSDELQKQADAMEGFRFYLPRPFVNVFESFPLHADVYVVDGVVSPDGKFVYVEVPDGAPLHKVLGKVGKTDVIPARDIKLPDSAVVESLTRSVRNAGMAVLAAQAGEAEARADKAEKELAEATDKAKEPDPPPSKPEITGQSARAVTNDNSAYAYQPMRGNMDIVYLPDFDEQYVVSSQANLGNATFQINLGQGWSLQGFNSLTDNSAINKRIFDLIDTSVDLAKQAAPALLGLPPLPSGAGAVLAPQAGEALAKGDEGAVPGTPVSLKITVLHYASKGLYPVIKPRELQKANAGTGLDASPPGGQGGFLLDISKGAAADKGTVAATSAQPRASIPVYPYQYIGFNTFQYLAIDVVETADAPFAALYDRTGTAGDPGDRQEADLVDYIVPRGGKDGGDETPGPTTPSDSKNPPGAAGAARLAAALSDDEFKEIDVDGTKMKVVKAEVTEERNRVAVSLDKEPSAGKEKEVVAKLFARAAELDPELEQAGAQAEMIRLVKPAADLSPQGGGAAPLRRGAAQSTPVGDPVARRLSNGQVRSIQAALCMSGTQVDGVWGPKTVATLSDYQQRKGHDPAKGVLTTAQRDTLLALDGSAVAAACDPDGQVAELAIGDPVAAALKPGQVRALQLALCLDGPQADGVWGVRTRDALRRWQAIIGAPAADGVLTTTQRDALLALSGADVAARCD